MLKELVELVQSIRKNTMILLVVAGLFVFTFVAGLAVAVRVFTPTAPVVTEDSKVLLEKVQKVCKLVTVEGTFSDIYSYKDYQYYDVSLFQKKALIVVNAKVLVGIDLTKAAFKADHTAKTLTITNIPAAEIMAIDPDMRYYDISEGTFNSFSPEELTKLLTNAKAQIKAKAEKSDLMASADKQGNVIFDMIEMLCADMGWKVVWGDKGVKPLQKVLT